MYEWLLILPGLVVAVLVPAMVALRIYLRGSCKIACKNRLDGKVVVITGATSGIGKVTAYECARKGAKVVLACRDRIKAERTVEAIRKKANTEDVYFLPLDLSSFLSIREFVPLLRKQFERVNVLVNNAAYMGPKSKTKDSKDMTFQVNYLGHFLLTNLIIREFEPSKASTRLLRVINLTSHSYRTSKLDFDDLMDNKPRRYDVYGSYGRSKLAMVLFTTELNYIFSETGVYAVAVHPGCVYTGLLRNYPGMFGDLLRISAKLLFRSPEMGAQSVVECACVHNPDQLCGKLVVDCELQEIEEVGKDYRAAEQLWELSKNLCNLDGDVE